MVKQLHSVDLEPMHPEAGSRERLSMPHSNTSKGRIDLTSNIPTGLFPSVAIPEEPRNDKAFEVENHR